MGGAVQIWEALKGRMGLLNPWSGKAEAQSLAMRAATCREAERGCLPDFSEENYSRLDIFWTMWTNSGPFGNPGRLEKVSRTCGNVFGWNHG